MLGRRDNNESVTTTQTAEGRQGRQPWDRFWELVLPDESDEDEEGSWEPDDFMSFGSDTETLSTTKSNKVQDVKSAKASITSIGSLSLTDSTLGSRSTADQGKSPLAALSSESSSTIRRVASLGVLSSGSASTDPRSLETRSTKGSFFSTSKMSGSTLTLDSKLSNIRKIKSRGPLDGFWECILGDKVDDEDEYETAWDPVSVSDSIVSNDESQSLSESSYHKEDVEREIRQTESDSVLDRKRKNFWRRGRKPEQSDQPSNLNTALGIPFFSKSTPMSSTQNATNSAKHQNTEIGATDKYEQSKITILALASGDAVGRLRSATTPDNQTSKRAGRWGGFNTVKESSAAQTDVAEAKGFSVFQNKAESQVSGTTNSKRKRLGISALVLAGSEASKRRVTKSRSQTIPESQALTKEKRWGGVSPFGGKKIGSGEAPSERSAKKKTSSNPKEKSAKDTIRSSQKEKSVAKKANSSPVVSKALIAGSGALIMLPFLRGKKSTSRQIRREEPKVMISSLFERKESAVNKKSQARANTTTRSVERAPAVLARREETKPNLSSKSPRATSTVTGGVAAASISIIAGLKRNGWTSQPKQLAVPKQGGAEITATRSTKQAESETKNNPKERRGQDMDKEALAFPRKNICTSLVPPQDNNSRVIKLFTMPSTSGQQGPLNRPKSEATAVQDESEPVGLARHQNDLPTISRALANHNSRRRKRGSRDKDDSSQRTLTSTSNSSNAETDDRWIWEIDATTIPAMNTLRTSLALGKMGDSSKKKSVSFSKDVDMISQNPTASFFRGNRSIGSTPAKKEGRIGLGLTRKESRNNALGSKGNRSHHALAHSPALSAGLAGQSERATPKVRSASYVGTQSDAVFDLRPAFDFDAFKLQSFPKTLPTQPNEKRKKATNKWLVANRGERARKERQSAAESVAVATNTKDLKPLPEAPSNHSRWPKTGQEFARQMRDSAFMVPLGSSVINSDCSDTNEGYSCTKDFGLESRNHESDLHSTVEEESRELQCDESSASTGSDNHLILLESLRSAKKSQDFSRHPNSSTATKKISPGRPRIGLYTPTESNSLLTSEDELHESFLLDKPFNSAFAKVTDDGSESEASEGEVRRKLWTGDSSPRPTQSRSNPCVIEENDDGSGKIFVNPYATATLPGEQRTVML